MKKKKALRKEFFMEIKKTYNRFLSICLIVALGTAFFAGVRAANPDMQMSADAFFDESNLMDIRVLSTLGLTEADVASILEIDGVEAAAPAYSQDVLAEKGNDQLVIKLMSVTDKVNLVTVDEGRMPQSPDECLADNLLIDNRGYKIGDTITVMSGDDTDIDDIVNTKTFTIVGRGRVASYLNLTRDSSQIGSGSVNGFLMIPAESFSLEAYTEIAVTVKDAAELDCYGEAYEEKIDEIVDKIEAIADSRCEIRYNEVVAEAEDKINDAQKEVDDGQAELDDAAAEIADGEAKLADAKAEVADGETQLTSAKAEVADGEAQIASAKVEVADGETQLASAKTEVADGEAQLASAKAELADGEAQLASAKAEIENGEAQLASAKAEIENGEAQLASAKAEVENGETQLADAKAEVENGETQLVSAKAEVADGEAQLASAKAEIENGEAQLASAKAEVADGEPQLVSAKTEVEDGEAQLASAKAEVEDGETQLADAKAQISENERLLSGREAEYNAALLEIESSRALLSDKRETYEENLAAVQEELALLEEKSEAFEETVSSVEEKRAELELARPEIETIKSAIAEKENGITALQRERLDLDEQIASNEAEMEDFLAKFGSDKDQWDENARIAYDTLLNEKEELETKASQITENVMEIERWLASAKSEVAQFEENEQQLLAAEAALGDVDEQRKQIAEQRAELEYALSVTLPESEKELLAQEENLNAAAKDLEETGILLAENRQQLEASKLEIESKEEQLTAAKQEIEENEAKLSAARLAIGENEAKLSAAKQEIEENETKLTAARITIEENEKQLTAAKQEIGANEAKLSAAKQEIGENEAKLSAARITIEEKEEQLAAAKQTIGESEKKLADGKREIEENEVKLADAKRTIEESEKKLADGKEEIGANEAKLADAKRTIEESEAKLADGKQEIEESEVKLADAKKEIADGEKELADGKKEYEEALEENEPKLADARIEIADAREALLKIKVPEWYVLDRDYIQTCVEYAQDAERIGKIGDIFPVIFFLVAALVSLTTMTRMVEEERTQIGTLKALGYSKGSIAAKYVLYAFSATMLGGIVGTVIGQKILPVIIMRAYSILYVTLTDYKAPLHFGYTVTALLAAVISTTVAVIAACYKELLSVPAQLMRPVAPKIGKRVWLERITFIWKRLNFSNKAAMRNLFRYKKRFFMTIIGIGGCMGLLLVGFGLKDSIMTIGDRQYNDIRTYDSTVTFSDDSTGEERSEVYESILNEERTSAAMMAMEETVDVSIDTSGKRERSAYLFVPSELERMDEFIVLQSRIGHEHYVLDNEGAVISEKLATLLDVSEGDEIYLEISDMNRVPVKVSHIVENYYFHYVYLSPSLYETIYGKDADYTEVFVEFDDASVDYEDEFSGKYLAYTSVSGVSYTRTMSERISEMIRSMDAIIYVIIISAGLLAFVVLYNLNNINISERKRELAALKVLGFYDGEVSIYVFRENIMLTLFGAFAGVFFGIALHRFVILTAEIDLMMFGRDIYLKSYIYSVLLTFAFSGIVNVAMHWKLKKIDMIESLKNVE